MHGSLNVNFAILLLNCKELRWERESHVKNVIKLASCLKLLKKILSGITHVAATYDKIVRVWQELHCKRQLRSSHLQRLIFFLQHCR